MTEQEKIDQLMKPRIIVTALWPFCRQHNNMEDRPKIGEIFHVSDGGTISNDAMTIMGVYKYPHLFRKLQWWEDRQPGEWPEYYKYSANHGVFKMSFLPNGGIVMLDVSATESVPCKLEYCLPATEAEYNAYIKSQTEEQ